MKRAQEIRLWCSAAGLAMLGGGLWILSPAYALIGVGVVLFGGFLAAALWPRG